MAFCFSGVLALRPPSVWMGASLGRCLAMEPDIFSSFLLRALMDSIELMWLLSLSFS